MSNLHISVGLPGSGKTTLFKKLRSYHCYFNCDKYHGDLAGPLSRYIKGFDFERDLYLDGLFLKKGDISKILEIVDKEGRSSFNKIVVHYWSPDVAACKWNDRGRRAESSTISIDKLEIDNLKELTTLSDEYPNMEFLTHEVERKPDWMLISDINNFNADASGVITGADRWSLGGNFRDCWGGNYPVAADDAPDGMPELDEILVQLAPDISFLYFRKISKEFVSKDFFDDHDYYGGSTSNFRYKLDFKELFKFLRAEGLLAESVYEELRS